MITETIYTILASKPHNSHYLNKYSNFINNCDDHNKKHNINIHREKHHICPKAKDLFPEYKNIKTNTWNVVNLTYRQHFIAHVLLAKTYDTISTINALLITVKRTNYGDIKVSNSRSIEANKLLLSEKMKGQFTRGYLEDGTPNVAESTKQILSKLKLEYYAKEENIIKCKEIRNSDKYDNANALASDRFTKLNISRTGIPLTESHKNAVSQSLRNFYSTEEGMQAAKERGIRTKALGRKVQFSETHLQKLRESAASRKGKPRAFDTPEWRIEQSNIRKLSKNVKPGIESPRFIGIFITSIGAFSTAKNANILYRYCKFGDKIIKQANIGNSDILNNSVLAMTYKQLGFDIITSEHPLFEQYCENLDQVHPSEPNHPLASELNDYLLQKKSHFLSLIHTNH